MNKGGDDGFRRRHSCASTVGASFLCGRMLKVKDLEKEADNEQERVIHIQGLGRYDVGAIRKLKKLRLARTTTRVSEAITQVIQKALDL